MKTGKIALALFATTALIASLPAQAAGDHHPHYERALSDLRTARYLLQSRPGDKAVSTQEGVALHEIETAIGDLKQAAVDDGKSIDTHETVTQPADEKGRLHAAGELLRHAINETMAGAKEIPAGGPRDEALAHIRAAEKATGHATDDARDHK